MMRADRYRGVATTPGWSSLAGFVIVLCATIITMAAIATRSDANVIVGATRAVELPRQAEQSIDQLRGTYRRPKVIPFPKGNPYTPEKAQLGKALYFDTRLSAANVLSCASCHSPAYGWGDGQPRGVGHGMRVLGRRSPTIINAAFGLPADTVLDCAAHARCIHVRLMAGPGPVVPNT